MCVEFACLSHPVWASSRHSGLLLQFGNKPAGELGKLPVVCVCGHPAGGLPLPCALCCPGYVCDPVLHEKLEYGWIIIALRKHENFKIDKMQNPG